MTTMKKGSGHMMLSGKKPPKSPKGSAIAPKAKKILGGY